MDRHGHDGRARILTGFAVLPDTEAGAAAARLLRSRWPGGISEIPHASGRPWLVGRWEPGSIVVASSGPVRVAAIGDRPPSPDALGGVRTVTDLDAVAGRTAGARHLVCSAGGEVRVQGTLALTRRVFHTRLAGCAVAADRADVLALAGDAAPDPCALALRMVFPPVPHPLADLTMWTDVHAVPGGHHLLLDARGEARTVRHWRPPAPDLPLPEAATAVRAALAGAVAARTGGPISADLSGGLDSTALCLLAARDTPDLVTYRHGAADPANDDEPWAALAAETLPGARHLVRPFADLPARYAELGAPDAGPTGPYTDPEEPFRWVRSQAWLAGMARDVAAAGSGLHLTGHGGDELFGGMPAALHTLARRHPLTALRQARGHRALRRWPAAATVRALLDRSSYPAWLAAGTHTLTGPLPPPTTPQLSWGLPFRLPPWATPDAVALVRDRLRATAPDPLAPVRVQHARLFYAQRCGRTIRQASRLTAAHGTPLAAPYLDDRVLDAALAARLDLHAPPDRYKPVLAAAMRDVLPAPLLTRRTKGDFSADTYTGLDRHRPELLELVDGSLLAQRGLVDADALRSVLLGPLPDTDPLWPFDLTLAAERWLRATHRSETPA